MKSDDEDVELFITRYIFKTLDSDDSGALRFGEFWSEYDKLVRGIARAWVVSQDHAYRIRSRTRPIAELQL